MPVPLPSPLPAEERPHLSSVPNVRDRGSACKHGRTLRDGLRIELAGLGIVNGIDLDEHAGLIWSSAHTILVRTKGRVTCAELLGPGWEGLRRAAQRFDPARGGFAGFASMRIKGAMLDYLRTQDAALSRYERTLSKATNRPTRRTFDWTSVAEHRGTMPDPPARAEPAEARELALELFRPLEPRLRRIALARFLEGLSISQIAQDLDCSKSSVALLVRRIRTSILGRESAFELAERPQRAG